MKTIILSTTPTPDLNVSKLHIDFNSFDPHCGPSFWITYYNANGKIIDREIQQLSFDAWQNWTSENDEISDYKYIADKVTEELGITYTSMDSPVAPTPEPTPTPTPDPVNA
jgi:hypothetical protein